MDPRETMICPVILPVPKIDRDRKGKDRVRYLSRYARKALRISCQQSGLALNTLPKDDKGVPLPEEGVYWSLSHKPAIVGAVASLMPVGLDLETIRPVIRGLPAKVADDAEWRLAGRKEERTLFRFWTAKEAVLKATGTGMAGLSRCRVAEIVDDTRMILAYDGVLWPVEHFWFDRHVAAITPHHFDVTWKYLSLDSAQS